MEGSFCTSICIYILKYNALNLYKINYVRVDLKLIFEHSFQESDVLLVVIGPDPWPGSLHQVEHAKLARKRSKAPVAVLLTKDIRT